MRRISVSLTATFVRPATAATIIGLPMVAATAPTSAVMTSSMALFNMKEHAMAKRKAREMERLGITEDVDDDDAMPWRTEEEQRKLDAEEEERQRERKAATEAMLREREAQDKLKKEKFKQWRAGQVAKSKQRNADNATTRHAAQQKGRTMESEVTNADELKMESGGDFKESDIEVLDIEAKRKQHRSVKNEMKRFDKGEDE